MAGPPITGGCRSLSRRCISSHTACSILPSTGSPFTRTGFHTNIKLSREITESAQTESGAHERSIAMLHLPRRAVKSDIKDLLIQKGYEVKKISIDMHRFTFRNASRCFVELANKEQATKAVTELDKSNFRNQKIFVQPLKEDFVWAPRQHLGHHFHDEGANACQDAVLPIIEGRRVMLRVQTPGWGAEETSVSDRKRRALETIDQHFSKYGIQLVGPTSPFFGDKKSKPRLLCFLDFETKRGADQAIEELHDTTIDGRNVWLQHCRPSPWRAHQIGKLDKAVLKELQEKGIVSEETWEDKISPPTAKQAPEKGT